GSAYPSKSLCLGVARNEGACVGDWPERKRRKPMHRINLDSVDLEYDVQGSGEPVLLIHGSIVADAFLPLLAEPRLTSNYRVITYHRRGFAGSARARSPCTMGQQAADGRALLRH